MDRRQKKTRQAIFTAFVELLSHKEFARITVGEIIDRADVGRATFYAHFETKEALLRELCGELFCHIFDAVENAPEHHRHIFDCDDHEEVFLHLFRHLQRNDNHILELISAGNNPLFLTYFKEGLRRLVVSRLALFESRRDEKLPESFWIDHVTATFVDTLRWWADNGLQESPETITQYFMLAV